MILFGFTEDGGFVAGDSRTGRTTYAYPTSTYAVHAKHDPIKVAKTMITFTNHEPYVPATCDPYDHRNWTTLGGWDLL